MTEKTATESNFAGQASINFHETLLPGVENQRSLHVMENLRCASGRAESGIGPKPQSDQVSRLVFTLEAEGFRKTPEQGTRLFGVFALFLLLGSELFRMTDKFLYALVFALPLRRVEFPVAYRYEALKIAVFCLTDLQCLFRLSVFLAPLAIAP